MRNDRGVSLVELLISMVLLAIVSVALIQSAIVAMNTNVMNELRDEAVRVAEARMNDLRNTPFAASDMQVTSPSGVTESPLARTVRGVTCQFTINRKISQVDSNNRQVTVTVTWNYRNVPYQHGVSTILRTQ